MLRLHRTRFLEGVHGHRLDQLIIGGLVVSQLQEPLLHVRFVIPTSLSGVPINAHANVRVLMYGHAALGCTLVTFVNVGREFVQQRLGQDEFRSAPAIRLVQSVVFEHLALFWDADALSTEILERGGVLGSDVILQGVNI